MNWFAGSTFRVWWNFLKANKRLWFPQNWLRVVFTSLFTLRNSRLAKKENELLNNISLKSIIVSDPIFILGHWRSGTTHLHNILINDSNFSYPTLLQVTFPNTFLTIQKKMESKRAEVNERPMDNVQISYNSPGEEEVAVWTMCNISSIGNRLLTEKEAFYDRFLTFKEASNEELNVWKENLIFFLKKISINDERKLLLKSPESTARIPLLLDLFPNAKFINIHRNPIDVFKSTKNLYQKVFKQSYFHNVSDEHLKERILKVYKEMYNAYFKSVNLISNKNFMDISYEELVDSPLKTIQSIYTHLNLELNETTKSKIEQYLNSIKDYKQNRYSDLDEKTIELLYDEWFESFKSWGYNKDGIVKIKKPA